jgi:hypothetical protein
MVALAAQAGRAITVGEATGLARLLSIASAVHRIADRRSGPSGVDSGTVGIKRAALRGNGADAAEARRARSNAGRSELAAGAHPARSVETACAGGPIRATAAISAASTPPPPDPPPRPPEPVTLPPKPPPPSFVLETDPHHDR